jgi:hypothetical protein
LDGLEEVLSGDEKHSIMMFIVTKDWKHMPAQIAPTKLTPREKPFIVFHLKPTSFSRQHTAYYRNYNNLVTLTFQVDKKATLAGLTVEGPSSYLADLRINLQFRDAGISFGNFSLEGKGFFKINPEVELTANAWYNLTFSGESSPTCFFSFPNCNAEPITSDGLALSICTPTIIVNLQNIMFRPLKKLAA